MKSFIIAWKDVKILLTDRRGFMMMLLMPILLTAILGSALSGVFESGTIPKTTIGYYQEDEDELGRMFYEDVLQSQKIKADIKVKTASSPRELEEMMRKEKVDVGMIIPANWSEQLQEGKLREVKLLTDPSKSIQIDIAESLIHAFSEQAQTVASTTKNVMEVFAQSQPEQAGNMIGKLQVELEKAITSEEEQVIKEGLGTEPVSSMQYYAAAMLVMFLLFNITVGAKSIVKEKRTETLARLLSTPTSSVSILLGKFYGTLLFACIQFCLFVFVTIYMFGVSWGDNIWKVLAIGFSYAICVSGLSMLLAAFIREEETADMLGGTGIQLLALLGGSMLPIYAFPEVMKKVANIAPNKWALTSLLDVMSGAAWQTIIPVIVTLMLIGIITVSVGTFRLRVR
ncbi:ABC transporter ATP-binding protein [Bacillus manliponensis]|uniref:ABC transporter ATP-binding protein n=1 Tax=Bacillus manliponensis TaxID=574376 RepID=A0A073JV31_9BACI|nr:ABC transporter permease [Bacillus manliponensis]KEK18051.1 ABC transporter ATP-binding protein [Bacillus manliponensis]